MRVGVIGPNSPDLLAWHILDSLPHVGAEAVWLGNPVPSSRNRFTSQALSLLAQDYRYRSRLADRVVSKALEQEVNLVITLSDNLMPWHVERLRREDVAVVLWHPDAISNHGRMWYAISNYTALYFKDPLLVKRLVDVQGLRATLLPEACNPRVHRPIGVSAISGDGAIAGNTYASRTRVLDRLEADKIPIRIFGSPIPKGTPPRRSTRGHQNRPIFGAEKARIFREAGFVLNNLHPAEMASNARLFEATACGAAVVTEWRPDLESTFDIDREVATFRTYDELREQARELLGDARLATSLGDAASRRAHADHTYEQRLPVILEHL